MPDKLVHPKTRSKLTNRQIADKRSTMTKRADRLIERLGDYAEGSKWEKGAKKGELKVPELTSNEIKAMGLYLSKCMPDLKSVEQTTKTETRKPEELLPMIRQLLSDNPDLLAQVLPESKSKENQTETKH